MNPSVCILKCRDYDRAEETLLRAIALLELPFGFENKKVLLKVNLMKGAPPERALNTHPEFIRAMIRIIHSRGGKVMVGDSSGLLGCTGAAFTASGIAKVVGEEGADLVNFDAGPLVKQHSDGTILKSFWISQKALDADIRISLPKLKTHTLTQLTGAVKNQLGLLPGGTKPSLHVAAPRVETLCRALVEINLAVRFDLAIMDGIVALEGGGSGSGQPKKAGVILASRDLVALDSVAAKVMGMEPSAVPTNKAGKQYGLGENDLGRIEIRGDFLEECCQKFLLPGREPKKTPLIAAVVYRFRQKSIKPLLLDSACTRCGRCAEICPVDAIEMEPVPLLKENCINCFCCYENCPDKAIRLTSPWYLRPLVRKRLAGLDLG